MTIQRKAVGISGGAGSDVLWVHYESEKGKFSGWYYKEQQQARLQLMMEDEFQKWFGISSMKDANGNLLAQPSFTDPETGLPVIQGDGIIPQIDGGNHMFGSGVTGEATIDDVIDMMTLLEKKCNTQSGKKWYIVTGSDGYATLQRLWRDYALLFQNVTLNVDGKSQIGGAMVDVGYHFASFNMNGNQVVAVKHPLLDDEERFTERGSDGKLIASSMMIFLDQSVLNGKSNIEILAKGGNGFKRDFVSAEIQGLTGKQNGGTVVTSEDAIRFEILIENMIVIYNTSSCGIIHKSMN
jgi:hypothetical protein